MIGSSSHTPWLPLTITCRLRCIQVLPPLSITTIDATSARSITPKKWKPWRLSPHVTGKHPWLEFWHMDPIVSDSMKARWERLSNSGGDKWLVMNYYPREVREEKPSLWSMLSWATRYARQLQPLSSQRPWIPFSSVMDATKDTESITSDRHAQPLLIRFLRPIRYPNKCWRK